LTQGRPTALRPCGARHPLRGFLSQTPTSLRRFSTCSGRRTPPMVFMGVLQRGQRACSGVCDRRWFIGGCISAA
jgi:hypothetical protein